MPLVRVAAVALNQTPLAWDDNAQNIILALEEARRLGATLVCLPELCISGYGCEDAFLWRGTTDLALRVLAELACHCRGLVVSLGLPLSVDGVVVSAAALLVDGTLVGVACKRHLAGSGLHYEQRWFTPWPVGQVLQVPLLGREVPVGDLVFEVGGVRLGFEICEDAWVAERPGHELAQAGVSLVLNPSASHFAFGKHLLRRGLVTAGARAFGCAYVYANLLGNEAGRAIYDGDLMIAERGGEGEVCVVAEGRRLSFADRQLACATLELASARERADGCVSARPIVPAPFTWPSSPEREPVSGRTPTAGADGELSKEEAFARVSALGLFDYLRKSRLHGFVVSLSGGADSAAVATLVRLMVRLGIAELGKGAFLEKLAHCLAVESLAVSDEAAIVAGLLTTVYQGTENSSETTRGAAAELARALGSRHHELDVQPLVDGYRALTEGALGRALAWATDDVTLQNLQARVRAPSVWALANVLGALLLATSNRSEAAVGYATMDGDTAGGLCPIGGIDKAYLRHWLAWQETIGVLELGALPALAAVNRQEPTAELRPLAQGQTDEAELMPYEVLELFERSALFRRLPALEVFTAAQERFPQYPLAQLKLWIERFYRLFAQNQWKRERYAPSFHVDDGNLDPKTWCRFPILSGGFVRELRELRAHFAAGAESAHDQQS